MNCILIVEDEPLIALDLRFACEDAGVAVVVAASARQALDAIADNATIDGAVLDVNLGQGETCETVARALRARQVPFVLSTGDLDRAGEFLRDIDAPIIGKPSAAEDVVARLMELNGRADKRGETRRRSHGAL